MGITQNIKRYSTQRGRMDKVIIYSIFMRTLCNPTIHHEAKKNLYYLQNKLQAGELKFNRANPQKYKEIFQIARFVWDDVKSRHSKKTMLNELLFLELHALEKDKFVKYFGLKDTKLVKMYRQYCNTNTVEQESESYQILEDLIETTNKALKGEDND